MQREKKLARWIKIEAWYLLVILATALIAKIVRNIASQNPEMDFEMLIVCVVIMMAAVIGALHSICLEDGQKECDSAEMTKVGKPYWKMILWYLICITETFWMGYLLSGIFQAWEMFIIFAAVALLAGWIHLVFKPDEPV